jgi:glycosyltransferase involved in cell wall biosynthesis
MTLFLWSLFAVLAFRKVARLHSKLKFDVVHVHNLPDFLVFAALIPKLRGAQVILHVQDVMPELMAVKSKGLLRDITVPLTKLQERISTAFADHVVTVGWPFEERLLQRGVPREKLSSILNSADPMVFPAEKRTAPFLGEATAERPLVLIYYGTFAERCGLDVGIRAFAKARAAAPHLRLRFKGSGESLPKLKQLAQSLGVGDYVEFSPGVPVHEVADFVAQGDISLIPYRADGFMNLVLPTKAYECALMRRPMIASDTIAMRSMFRPSSVMFCQPASVDSFAEAIIDLYRNPQKRAQLAASAEQDYAQYRWELVAEQYRQLLASLAAKSKKRAPARWQTAA